MKYDDEGHTYTMEDFESICNNDDVCRAYRKIFVSILRVLVKTRAGCDCAFHLCSFAWDFAMISLHILLKKQISHVFLKPHMLSLIARLGRATSGTACVPRLIRISRDFPSIAR